MLKMKWLARVTRWILAPKVAEATGELRWTSEIMRARCMIKWVFRKQPKLPQLQTFFGAICRFCNLHQNIFLLQKNTNGNVKFREQIPSKVSHGLPPETANMLDTSRTILEGKESPARGYALSLQSRTYLISQPFKLATKWLKTTEKHRFPKKLFLSRIHRGFK